MKVVPFVVVAFSLLLSVSVLAIDPRAKRDSVPVTISLDAKWSAFGDYIQISAKTLQDRWLAAVKDEKVTGHTSVTFVLSAEGKVTIDPTDTTEPTVLHQLAVKVVSESAPFPKWSEPMKTALGISEKFTVVFRTPPKKEQR